MLRERTEPWSTIDGRHRHLLRGNSVEHGRSSRGHVPNRIGPIRAANRAKGLCRFQIGEPDEDYLLFA
jgi:hypothetical protein